MRTRSSDAAAEPGARARQALGPTGTAPRGICAGEGSALRFQTPGLVRPQGASVAGPCGNCAGQGSDGRFQTLGLVRPPGA